MQTWPFAPGHNCSAWFAMGQAERSLWRSAWPHTVRGSAALQGA